METSHEIAIISITIGIIANFGIFIGVHWRLKKQREFTERNIAEQREALARYTEMHEESKAMRADDNRKADEHLNRWNKAMDRYERLRRQQ